MKKEMIIRLLKDMDMTLYKRDRDGSIYFEYDECWGFIYFDENDEYVKTKMCEKDDSKMSRL